MTAQPVVEVRHRSEVCPQCQSPVWTKVKEHGSDFVIVSDRQCAECGTRYSPPVPRWAPMAMCILGAAVMIGFPIMGVLMVIYLPMRSYQATGTLIFAGAGLWLLRYGMRMMRDPGEPVTVELCGECGAQLPQARLKKCPKCKAKWD